MSLMDVLSHYAQQPEHPPPQVLQDFHQVSRQAPPEAVGEGLEEAFRSDETPPFEEMVGHLFERSDPHQRAGLLNEILGAFGGMSGGLAGGVLGGALRNAVRGDHVSPEDAREVPVSDVEAAAAEAARRDPGIIERVSRFYAQHPQLVQTLGSAALSIAMAQMARRRRI
jgi:hypothetical protein